MVVLGFDFGMKYIGVAVGQDITKTAQPLTSLYARDGVPHWKEIQTIITDWAPTIMVVGIPLNMDGSEQTITLAARRFSEKLKKHFPLPVHLVDERLSTWQAKERMAEYQEQGLHKKSKNKKQEYTILNATAAAILVEQWFSENT